MEASEDLEHNLRLFAMRKAAAASKEFSDLKSRVVVSVQSGPNRHCPMHGGGKHGNYHHSHTSQPQQHPQVTSRKEMAKELRLYSQSREARERSFEHQSRRMAARSQSLEPNNAQIYGGSGGASLPRRFSSASPHVTSVTSNPKVNRHGSFQQDYIPMTTTVKKDTFTPKVDFKSTLRSFNPKDDERSRGLNSHSASNKSLDNGELMDYHDSNSYFTQQLTLHNPYSINPRRGMVMAGGGGVDSSGPASLPIMGSNPRPKSRLRLDLSNNSRPASSMSLKSPSSSRPQSPRRVEFADEVFFNFNGHHMYQRSASTDLNPHIVKKPILRHVNSEATAASNPQKSRPLSLIEQFQSQNHKTEPLSPLVIEHTNLDTRAASATKYHTVNNNENLENEFANQRKVSQTGDDSLVQIYIPPSSSSKDTTDQSDDDEDTISAGSDADEAVNADTNGRMSAAGSVTSNGNISKKSEVRRTLSAEVASRKVPPKLSDWNRSQSFPPPKAANAASSEDAEEFNGLQKSNSILTDSEASLPTKECRH